MGPGVNLATLRLFVEHCSPFRRDAFSKDAYLNDCLEELYIRCEKAIEGKMGDINKMSTQVEKLQEIAQFLDDFGDDPAEAEQMMEGAEDKEGNPIKIKPRKQKMCENFLKGKPCTEKDEKCKYAHFAHELELVHISDKVKNLKGVIES
eukprot:CAMPEP_0176346066 /NCGR_PEP_ID=MMETSP0126-20121128/5943_1 /TAXON_ID=141414 ORGANISM="Strombidinopsis acuminatum, Strain SPMC142" /NCGR_SAMPLE_ID=MMETSP0126 /ASSEMBLY_ACC=CAM_ASM_000229 /LENGTH=148 /DNA_ID=CAMNT_0017693385 /DNA_START=2326 /DNA_END=2772 /DNA_ORIENTATION=-